MAKKKKTSSLLNMQFLQSLVILLFSLSWFAIVVLDYLFHHPYYTQNLNQFKYWGLLGLLFVLLGLFYFAFRKIPKFSFNGWKVYLLLLILMNSILAWYGISNQLFSSHPITHLAYFTGFVLLLHIAVLFLTLIGYLLGDLIIRPFAQILSSPTQILIAIALGWSTLGFLMVILGLFNALNPWILWGLFLSLVILRYRSTARFLKTILIRPVGINQIKIQGFLSIGVLLIFIAINSIGAIKAFPIGFDGTALYMNLSKLIGEYQGLPQGGQAFNWSVIMSLGHLLFNSTSIAILMSHLMSVFCLCAVYRIARLFVSSSNALLASALFYSLPIITFHNYYDEKVDLAFLFISLTSLLLLLEYFLKQNKEKQAILNLKIGSWQFSYDLLLWIYVGWLTGFAFGIKYIALFSGIALVSMFFYRKGGKFAFFGSLFVGLSFVFLSGIYRFAGLDLASTSPILLSTSLLILGIGLIYWQFRSSIQQLLKMSMILAAFLALAALQYAPWAIKHSVEKRSFSMTSLIEGKSAQPNIRIKSKFLKNPQQKNKAAKNDHAIVQKTKREELQRYQGYEKGLPLYLSLPYDLTMNTNLPNLRYLDIGFLCLLLLPLFFLSTTTRHQFKNLLLLLLVGIIGMLSITSVYVTKSDPIQIETFVNSQSKGFRQLFGVVYESGMNTLVQLSESARGIFDYVSEFGFGLSLFILLLLLVCAFWLAAEKRQIMPTLLKSLLAFAVSYLLLWTLLGSAVPWYAFPILALFPVLVGYYFEHPEHLLGEKNVRFTKYFLTSSFGLYFLLNLSLQFSDPDKGNNRHLIFQPPFIQYATTDIDQDETLAQFSSFFLDLKRTLNNDPNAKIYRIGTYMEYHVSQNDQRVLEDNQLGRFDAISSKLSNPKKFIQILRKNGFRYILYDLNSAKLDQTPEQTLRQKNIDFINLLLQSNKIKSVVTDRIIKDASGDPIQLPNGTIRGKPGIAGKVIRSGTFILFEI